MQSVLAQGVNEISKYKLQTSFHDAGDPYASSLLIPALIAVGVVFTYLWGPYVKNSLESLYNKYQERRERKSAEKIVQQ